MLFKRLGDITAKHATAIILVWLGVLIATQLIAPRWHEVVQNGEFAFLPEDAPSRIATEGFREAFPNDMLASNMVLLARRTSGTEGLLDSDYAFLRQRVIPELHRIAGLTMPEDARDAQAGIQTTQANETDPAQNGAPAIPGLVERITWFDDTKIGDLLVSEDKKATTIVLGLKTEFLDQANIALVDRVEKFVRQLSLTHASEDTSLPGGLDISVSGSATFGRDMIREAHNSAKSTEKWTVILVVGLLIMIYRAPALAMIPLVTVAVATSVSLCVLAIGARMGIISLFNGIETYVTVLIYGAGVDYCLFLISRYREELDGGETIEEAISGTLHRIGAALTASAGTVMCGIGMLVFAEFGKFRQAGLAITFGLAVCLLASLTLTPAILRLIGKWAFWPTRTTIGSARAVGFPTSTDLVARLQKKNLLTAGWHWVGSLIERRSWATFLGSLALMLPFTIVGIIFFGDLSYGLLSELPKEAASVRGAEAVQGHFPAGEVAPLCVLVDAGSQRFEFRLSERVPGEWQVTSVNEGNDVYLLSDFLMNDEELRFSVPQKKATYSAKKVAKTQEYQGEWVQDERSYAMTMAMNDDLKIWSGTLTAPVMDFSPVQGDSYQLVKEFTERLVKNKEELGLYSVRSLSAPKGQRPQAKLSRVAIAAQKNHARNYFVSSTNPAVTRVDLVFVNDPFSRTSISDFRTLRDEIYEHLPEGLKGASLSFVGNTADISDLKDVTDSDQIRIDALVLLGVYLILVALLRRPGICAYLMFTVFYSYLATLGITYLAFWAMDPQGFAGLDWKVPMFLFTILIAVGEDYNIFLMARIEEEQKEFGPLKGITVALERTGSIISSCGIIMAGTFSSLMAGSLVGMDQLGFALALGVMLDTFVIRPIMVPSLLILLTSGRLGIFSRWAGFAAQGDPTDEASQSLAA
ncbi:MAG: MMPL family transporter [Planctomycetota bacterium]